MTYALGHVLERGLLTAHNVYAYALYACLAAAATQVAAVGDAADAAFLCLFCHSSISFIYNGL